MTPELKQDLDALFTFTSEQAMIIHQNHGVVMDDLEIRLHGDDCECDDIPVVVEACDCEGCCEATGEPLGLAVESYDDFNLVMGEACELFVEEVSDAKENFAETMEALETACEEAGLDDDVLTALAVKHITTMQAGVMVAMA